MDTDPDPLCCCEYQNSHGERAHLLGLFCDCAELDDAVDKLISGVKIPSNRLSTILEVLEDRLRLPWPRGALKLPMDKISPWILVPMLFQIASYNWKTQLLVHGGLLPLVIFCKYKTCLKSYRPETKFFVSWSLATFGFLFYVYQIHIIGIFNLPKTISPLENLVLIGFLSGAIYSVYKIKTYNHHHTISRTFSSQTIEEKCKNNNNSSSTIPNYSTSTRFCKICSQIIPEKDHHCVWIDACISNHNMKYFLSFLASIFCSLVQAGLIFLTSVCLPLSEVGPFFLIPDRWCQRWNTHFEGDTNITWTAGIHCLILAIAILCLLVAKSVSHMYHLYHLLLK